MSFNPADIGIPLFPVYTAAHPLSMGLALRPASLGTASTAWGTANMAIYVPFTLTAPFTVAKLLAYNGTITGGNTDIGIYSETGTEILGIAAAAQAGTSVWQEFDVTDTTLAPGLYYIGLLNTTTTGTYFAWNTIEYPRSGGVFSQAVGAATLPSPTATFAKLTSFGVPLVGMSSRTLI